MLENIRLSFHGILGHKLRSALTMLGIIIGIASIIVIVSTIQGTNEQIKQNLIGAGNNSVDIRLYDGDYPINMSYYQVPDGVTPISEETKAQLQAIREVNAVSLFTSRYAQNVYYGAQPLEGGMIYGVDGDYFKVFGYTLKSGRAFAPSDFLSGRKVVVLDEAAAASLFPDMSPIDKTIELSGEPFTVVGVVRQGTQFMPVINSLDEWQQYFGDSAGGMLFLTDTAWPIVYRYDEPQSVAVQAINTDSLTQAGKKSAEILNSRLSLPEGSSIKYKSQDLLEKAKQMQELATASNRQLAWIAGISLIVGGIGVMNIMLVSVTERYREIGLKKALGARKGFILFQFLTEAAVLTSLGGIIGVVAGIIGSQLYARITQTPAAVSVPFAILGVAFSMIIGLVFGVFPAYKASNLNPIDALRQQ